MEHGQVYVIENIYETIIDFLNLLYSLICLYNNVCVINFIYGL